MRKNHLIRSTGWTVSVLGAIASQSVGWTTTADAQVLPPNPDLTCRVSADEFKTWFRPHSPGLDQPVQAADSIHLDIDAKRPNCNFYKWSAQMFLWLTSPAAGLYPGNRAPDAGVVTRVFDSPIFYQVRGDQLEAQRGFGPRNLSLRATKFGPDGLPVVIDARGHIREFVTAPPNAKVGGREITAVRAGRDGKAELLDAAGGTVPNKPVVTIEMLPKAPGRLDLVALPSRGPATQTSIPAPQQIADALTAKKVLIKFGTKSPVFVEAGTGVVDDLGPGQAGSDGVLLSQQKALIFYEILVNDVYAWYLTGRKTPDGIPPYYYNPPNPGNPKAPAPPPNYGQFPITGLEAESIIAFAREHGGPPVFPDTQALAVEAKLAWVDATTLPDNARGYITAKAVLPKYNTSNPADWAPINCQLPPDRSKPGSSTDQPTPDSEQCPTATVALVGVHIVGSANGHPEMVWSTFEHEKNTPLATYTYNSDGRTMTVSQNTTGNWIFSANGGRGPYNTQLATYCSVNEKNCTSKHIFSTPPASIGPSNILREEPWGVTCNGIPNQQDKTPADANTLVLSLNTQVRSRLREAGAEADPRFNYLFIGSTWTEGGAPPSGAYANGGNEIGTNTLANSTMETFVQGSNCFDCHGDLANPLPQKADTSVSHIFSQINPLSMSAQTKEK